MMESEILVVMQVCHADRVHSSGRHRCCSDHARGEADGAAE
jgi:hypothetical protein